MSMLREFNAELEQFAGATAEQARLIFAESAATACEAIAIGNEFGPGAPLDTGYLRASFRVGVDTIVNGPSTPPQRSKRSDGTHLIADVFDASPVQRVQIGQTVYLVTNVDYAKYLETGHMTRRHGEHVGQDTEFIAPVEARFGQIVDDAADRVGYGRDTSNRDAP